MDLRPLLRQLNLRPSRGRGQSFLTDESVLDAMLEAADVSGDDAILEIGPGLGVLTQALARRAGSVVAVELEPALATHLRKVLTIFPNTRLVEGDILAVPAELLPLPPYKIVANIPYSITSAVFRRFLESPQRPTRMVVMVQNEVAERVAAKPGRMSLLAVSVQLYAVPQIVRRVPARAFYPVPDVDSAVLRLDIRPQPAVEVAPQRFFRVTTAGFSQKRKQLHNSLAGGLAISPAAATALLTRVGIEPSRRAETLSLEEWSRLALVAP